jgi:hypothetical protein
MHEPTARRPTIQITEYFQNKKKKLQLLLQRFGCRQVIALHLHLVRGDGKGDERTGKSVHAPTAEATLVGQRSQALRVSRV